MRVILPQGVQCPLRRVAYRLTRLTTLPFRRVSVNGRVLISRTICRVSGPIKLAIRVKLICLLGVANGRRFYAFTNANSSNLGLV